MSQIVLTLAKISKAAKILAKKRLNILTLANLSSLHKRAMEISRAIVFLQIQNGHGNFHVSFWQAQNDLYGHFFFTNTKWPWKFPRPFSFFYKH